MQLSAGRSADQWRGFAALDAGHSDEHVTRDDSAKHRTAWRHQHRSDNGGYANAEHIGLRRKHDDESDNARHDGTGQQHGRRGNAGRIAARLLTGNSSPSPNSSKPSSEFSSRSVDPAATGSATTTKGGRKPPLVVAVDWISAAITPRRGKPAY
jgi:hypothetical protein